MDYCRSLMRRCRETERFIIPVRVSGTIKSKRNPLEFTKEDNELNLRRCQKKKFYDTKICRHLCSSTLVLETTRTNLIAPCESICFELTRSFDSAGEICPSEKYCKNGCPCPFYKCEKLTDSHQKLIPLFDLKKSENLKLDENKNKSSSENLSVDLITRRWEGRNRQIKKFPLILSDFSGRGREGSVNASDSFSSYDRFYLYLPELKIECSNKTR